MAGSSGPLSKKPLFLSENENDRQSAPVTTPPASAAPDEDAAAAPGTASEATEAYETAADSEGQEPLGAARAGGLADIQQAASSQSTGAGEPHEQDDSSQQQPAEVKEKKQKASAPKNSGAASGGSPLQQQQKQDREEQPTEERLEEAGRPRQQSVDLAKEAERPDRRMSGAPSEVTLETSAEVKSAADTAAEVTLASGSSEHQRVYTVQQMMRYAVKSQRPYHPSVPLEAGQTQPVGLQPKDGQQPRGPEESCSGRPAQPHQQHGVHSVEGNPAAGEVETKPQDSGSPATKLAASSGNTRINETPQEQGLEAEAASQGSAASAEDYFRPCFCEWVADLANAAAAAVFAAASQRVSGRGEAASQPAGECARHKTEEAHPAWAGQGQDEELRSKGAPGVPSEEYACVMANGEQHGDLGLAAFSMGDIRLAEKALEGGMTLEGYFRSVKGDDARGAQGLPQRELQGPTQTLRGLDSCEQHDHQLPKSQDDGLRGLWSNELTCSSPQATVGLGGIPLERDVEEEFSFLEETEFPLRGDARGKGPHTEKSGHLSEPTRARAQAAAAAAAAAAHAAAVAPSNPGAASVAAWFTTMLAAPPESSNSPEWYNRVLLNAENQAAHPKAEGSILNLLSQNAGVHRQDANAGQQQLQGALLLQQQRNSASVGPQPQFGFQQQHTQQQHLVHQRKQQIHQQQLYLQYQQRQLNQQQAMARRPRAQPLDAAQGREAGRQLLSLIGVVPRTAAEDSRGSPLGENTSPSSQGSAYTPYAPVACEDPTPTAAAELGRQLLQRNHHLQQHQQTHHMQQQQAYFQHPQQQHAYMQQYRPFVQAPSANSQFAPSAPGPALQPGGLPSGGVTPLGRLVQGPGEYTGSSVILNRPQVSRGSSGEKNLLKLLHAGGETAHSCLENNQSMPAAGRGGRGAIIKREESGGPL
ncbi:hypothetical protein ACSSS7_000722 [Eimeria intestinalis]